jgi:GNAT superfamily N-acetyltransferase
MFVEEDGGAVAALVALPDLNQVLHRFDGRLFPSGILHLLNRRRIMNRIRLILMGVRPAYRRRGLEALLIDELGRRALERGMVECEMSWILEDNEGVLAVLRAAGVEHYKTYRLYEKRL